MTTTDAVSVLADKIMSLFDESESDIVTATAAMGQCLAFLFLFDCEGDRETATKLASAHDTMVKELIKIGLHPEEDI